MKGKLIHVLESRESWRVFFLSYLKFSYSIGIILYTNYLHLFTVAKITMKHSLLLWAPYFFLFLYMPLLHAYCNVMFWLIYIKYKKQREIIYNSRLKHALSIYFLSFLIINSFPLSYSTYLKETLCRMFGLLLMFTNQYRKYA